MASAIVRWLLPASALLALVGYFGPWIPHRAAGLVVTGLDLGEYVKFLHPVRSGQIELWREGFYLPLVAVSGALSLHAYRRTPAYPWPVRIGLLLIATVAALNLLPPAWSPPLLRTAEFRTQTAGLLICLALVGTSPLLALLPGRAVAIVVLLLAMSALWLPIAYFLRVLPAIEAIYGRPLSPGWGPWAMGAGLASLSAVAILELVRPGRASALAEPLGFDGTNCEASH